MQPLDVGFSLSEPRYESGSWERRETSEFFAAEALFILR